MCVYLCEAQHRKKSPASSRISGWIRTVSSPFRPGGLKGMARPALNPRSGRFGRHCRKSADAWGRDDRDVGEQQPSFSQFSCVAWVPEGRRDRNKADPLRGDCLTGTRAEICRVAGTLEEPVRERTRGAAGVNCNPRKHRLCVHAITRSFVATITLGSVVQFPPVSSSVLNK